MAANQEKPVAANETAETLTKMDAIVDEMNASRLQQLWNRWIQFPTENIVQWTAAGAYSGGFWGGIWGTIFGGGTPAGTVTGVGVGGGIGAGIGAFVGTVNSIGKNARMLNGDSYQDWQHVKAGRILKKRETKRQTRNVSDALRARQDATRTIDGPAYAA